MHTTSNTGRRAGHLCVARSGSVALSSAPLLFVQLWLAGCPSYQWTPMGCLKGGRSKNTRPGGECYSCQISFLSRTVQGQSSGRGQTALALVRFSCQDTTSYMADITHHGGGAPAPRKEESRGWRKPRSSHGGKAWIYKPCPDQRPLLPSLPSASLLSKASSESFHSQIRCSVWRSAWCMLLFFFPGLWALYSTSGMTGVSVCIHCPLHVKGHPLPGGDCSRSCCGGGGRKSRSSSKTKVWVGWTRQLVCMLQRNAVPHNHCAYCFFGTLKGPCPKTWAIPPPHHTHTLVKNNPPASGDPMPRCISRRDTTA